MLSLTYERHSSYAASRNIDYAVTIGHPALGMPTPWNKIVLVRQALAAGYDDIAWLDTDTLIVDTNADIFPTLPDRSCVAMARFDNVIRYGSPHHNSGVFFVRNGLAARRMMWWVWWNRRRVRPEYTETFWEQNQILEYGHRHASTVVTIGHEYNFIDGLVRPSGQAYYQGIPWARFVVHPDDQTRSGGFDVDTVGRLVLGLARESDVGSADVFSPRR